MLTRPQQITLKRAQQQAGIADQEYRETLAFLSKLPGCSSSTDPRLTDEHFDILMAYFEAIYWNRQDRPAPGATSPFRQKGYWARKNPKGNTSRDRYTDETIGAEIAKLENELNSLGFGFRYTQTIQNKIQPFSLFKYKAALERTLQAKRKKATT